MQVAPWGVYKIKPMRDFYCCFVCAFYNVHVCVWQQQVIQVTCHWIVHTRPNVCVCVRVSLSFRSYWKLYWISSALLCVKFIVSIIQHQQQRLQQQQTAAASKTHPAAFSTRMRFSSEIVWLAHIQYILYTYIHIHIFCIFYGAPSAATLTRAARDPLLTALTLTFMDQPTHTHIHLRTSLEFSILDSNSLPSPRADCGTLRIRNLRR